MMMLMACGVCLKLYAQRKDCVCWSKYGWSGKRIGGGPPYEMARERKREMIDYVKWKQKMYIHKERWMISDHYLVSEEKYIEKDKKESNTRTPTLSFNIHVNLKYKPKDLNPERSRERERERVQKYSLYTRAKCCSFDTCLY